MSKIEAYKAAASIANQVADNVSKALGRDSSINDKHSAYASFKGLDNANWGEIKLGVHLSYGYYGSSSGYRATSENLGRYLAKAVSKHMPMLLDECAAMADDDAEKARKEATDEARSVLVEANHA